MAPAKLEALVERFEALLDRLEATLDQPSTREERERQSKELDEFIKNWRKGRLDAYFEDE